MMNQAPAPYLPGRCDPPQLQTMNGQLSEQPLPELIREISEKGFSGALRLSQERLKAVVYFENGEVVYAAANLRRHRLREYLVSENLLTMEVLSRFGDSRSDLELAELLAKDGHLRGSDLDRIQTKQVREVLRLAIPWTSGTWEFDARSHLKEALNLKLDIESLLLEGSRTIAPDFAASRFRNPAEIISPVPAASKLKNLSPEEGFLLSRIEQPMGLPEVVAVSGQPEKEALRLTYSLSLAGLLQRERWNQVFRANSQPAAQREQSLRRSGDTSGNKQTSVEDVSIDNRELVLKRISQARTHYVILGVSKEATTQEIKKAYYELARRYHPDLFRQESDQTLKARIESAFTRITQAYDTLRNPSLRSAYDSKLDNVGRAEDFASVAPKANETVNPTPQSETANHEDDGEPNPTRTNVQLAEEQFKEGIAALKVGELSRALGLLSTAARLVPTESQYRAYYGQALSKNSQTRRAAESELLVAIKLEPANADYRIMLAELYLDLGFTVRARSELERALTRDQNHQKGRELLRGLQAGG
jgi:curved DNA-binding protein CbpA